MEGSLWSGSMFSFTSPIDTIMDKDEFKIEDLLAEDDILQEIKSNNMRLVDKLCEYESVETIVKYITEPAPEGSDDIRIHKYPYMACEVICCEVTAMIDIIVEAKNGELMNRLFSMITREELIQNRLAGYFEKTLQVLFKRKSLSVLAYLDSKGVPLFKSFCKQLHNYSIMQSMRILLLPAVQLAREDSAVGYMMEENELSSTPASSLVCIWHKDPSLITYLVEQLTTMKSSSSNNDDLNSDQNQLLDKQAHISELLISIIDLSSHDSIFHQTMTSASTIDALAQIAIPSNDQSSSQSLLLDGNKAEVLSVLEMVVMQFCDENNKMMAELAEEAAKMTSNKKEENGDATGATKGVLEDLLKNSTKPTDEAIQVLSELIPRISIYLKNIKQQDNGDVKEDEDCLFSQSGVKLPKLGLGKLRLVNLIEKLLRLENSLIDVQLYKNDVLLLILDLFFKYEWHSLLHQGVMSCVMLVVEGENKPERVALQKQLIDKAGLLPKLMQIINSTKNAENEGDKKAVIGPLNRPGQFGHAVVMCESIMKGIVEGGSMADAVSESKESDLWHDFMLSTLSQVTSVQCKPTGGYSYPSRHEDVMVGFGGSGDQGMSSGDGDLSMDDVSDESLAEQISRLGLQYGNMFSNAAGGSNGDGNDSDEDEEEEAALAMALAAAYGKGSSLGGGGGGSGGSMMGKAGGGSSFGSSFGQPSQPSDNYNDDGNNSSDDDEEEETKLAMMMMAQYGKKGADIAVTNVEVVKEDSDQSPHRRDTPLYPASNDIAGFADFDSAPSSTDGGFADFGSAPPVASTDSNGGSGFADFDSFGDFGATPSTDTTGGFADFNSAPTQASTEANDVANWGDSNAAPAGGDAFADFGDFGGASSSNPISPDPKSSTQPSPPPAGFGASPGVDTVVKNDAAPTEDKTLDFDAF